jgi:hypothetical protein
VATSRLPALKAGLKTLLEAQANLSGVLVSYGWPRDVRRELVILGDAEITQEYRAIGAAVGAPSTAKREGIELTLVVSVVGEGPAQQTATERALTLLGYIETAIRTDPRVGSSVEVASLTRYRVEELVNDTAREARITGVISATAYI